VVSYGDPFLEGRDAKWIEAMRRSAHEAIGEVCKRDADLLDRSHHRLARKGKNYFTEYGDELPPRTDRPVQDLPQDHGP
jgi:hypothetical protein